MKTKRVNVLAKIWESEVSEVWIKENNEGSNIENDDVISVEVDLSSEMYKYSIYDDLSGTHEGTLTVPLAPEQAKKFIADIQSQISSSWIDTLDEFASAIGGSLDYVELYEPLYWNKQ